MVACRQSTLQLIQGITQTELRQQAHPDFSPIGWHVGHIAYTESLWLLEHLKGDPCPYPDYCRLFAADGLPKAEREHLPALSELLAFLETIRDRTLTYLDTAPLYDQLRLWRWLVQHESQHAETATYVLALHRQSQTANRHGPQPVLPLHQETQPNSGTTQGMVWIPGGTMTVGHDALDALDNERPVHTVALEDYWLDRTPVTVADYATFIQAGGYHQHQWWHPQGWDWIQTHSITQPLYWRHDLAGRTTPVCGVSWYEAHAYASFVGKRLPTEYEWERAARWHPSQPDLLLYPWGNEALTDRHCNFGGSQAGVTPVGAYPAGRSASGCDDLLGNVWEWTNSWFEPYPEFVPYPYTGYSQVYFDRAHRVLRGGCWATRPWTLRSTFRNWYHPWVRQLFAGFRCALSA